MSRVVSFIALAGLLIVSLSWGSAPRAQQVPQSMEQVRLSFAPVVKKTVPAVVNIYTRRRVEVQQSASPLMNDPVLRQFFGAQMGGAFVGIPRERVVSSLGSGVIVKPEGLIVTSNHVIKDAQDIRVVLADKREFTAQVMGKDEQSDLALLKIDGQGKSFPALALRDSDLLEVGELVLAVGNPFGVGQTVTSGIISALSRSAAGVSDYQFFIQTDAAINPGNSGGALVDMDGRLIGINTAIYSKTGGYQGIGFAIPSNMVSSVVSNLAKGGKMVHPWLGAGVQEVTAEIAESLGLNSPKGALLGKITPDGPAARAGLKSGDVILALGGVAIEDRRSLQYRLTISPLGQAVPVKFWRAGREEAASLILTAAPEKASEEVPLTGRSPLSGLAVADLSPALNVQLGLPEELEGVIVLSAQGGADYGIVPGDMILEVNGAAIDSVKTLQSALKKGASAWKIRYRRGNAVLTLVVAS